MYKLLQLYKNKIINKLYKKFNYKCIMQAPRLLKVVINIGLNNSLLQKKYLNDILKNLSLISAQKPIVTNSTKSIANFKIRRGEPLGCKVTLRKKKMWGFLDKLIFIVIPRIRDFRGFSVKSIDKNGNLNIGIKEHTVFPEINYENVKFIHGMNVSIVLTPCSLEESFFIFNCFYFPFKNDDVNK